jgi:excisionase family DNA binding protein
MNEVAVSRVAYSIDETAQMTSLSKSFIRKEIRAGRLRSRSVGRRVLIMVKDLEAYLSNDPEESDES